MTAPIQDLIWNRMPQEVTDITPDHLNRYIEEKRDGKLVLSKIGENLYVLTASKSVADEPKDTWNIFATSEKDEADRVFKCIVETFQAFYAHEKVDKDLFQAIIDMKKANPTYKPVHLASALGLTESFKAMKGNWKDTVSQTTESDSSIDSVLHVAARHGKTEIIRLIIADNPSFDGYFKTQENTRKMANLFHLAVQHDDSGSFLIGEIRKHFNSLSTETKTLLQTSIQDQNTEGNEPVHVACMMGNSNALLALLHILEDIAKQLDSHKNEKRPRTYGVVERVNRNGKRVIEIALAKPKTLARLLGWVEEELEVKRLVLSVMDSVLSDSNVPALVHLLYRGMDNTCEQFYSQKLHVAADFGSWECFKLLVAWGECDVDAKDDEGHTVRHKLVAKQNTETMSAVAEALYALNARGAKRCSTGTAGCKPGCISDGTYNGERPTPGLFHAKMDLTQIKQSLKTKGPKREDKRRVLCLDGGGMRGLITCQMLYEMDKQFNNHSTKKKSIMSYFDIIAGTSAGALLALALATDKTPMQARNIFMKLGSTVFEGTRPYCSKTLESHLKKIFGAKTKMESTSKKTIIVACDASRFPPKKALFRSYAPPKNISSNVKTPQPSEYIWRAAKVTSAAPTYFELDDGTYIDGGLMANNPTVAAFTELLALDAEKKETSRSKLPTAIVSLGTGLPPELQSAPEEYNTGIPTSPQGLWKTDFPTIVNLFYLLLAIATETEGEKVELPKNWCLSSGLPYMRLNPDLKEEVQLDETDEIITKQLLLDSSQYMNDLASEMETLFEFLNL